ncbi:sugar ABC transporter permease [Microbacterium sp. zg.Y1090]|uniref:carbohydrate ABC transporter permease n=1 Tax=Microbacterium TaxID=33882 RepID=UPI00214BA4C8|nr:MULTISPECIES: sugar ABC transporter permease [unclassified Microbacterium]MCR2813670.1 sugar ABC transporter permease [Microbacterium sp. zg.Y1084]MCR2817997.1 sugar ABC transporter permease [Microbacterium sp. zg.Y1090]MDL5488085.1 sugar ABC transporter permease [Microbacterium sp. zg-Y1211]WIM27841.1 sugar ABC transporter permease [Microbacterium sp. zg-Y1090]
MATIQAERAVATARASRGGKSGLRYGIAFIGPFVALYVVFVLIPVVQAVVMSVHDWDLLGHTREFIGVDNYVRMLWGVDITWSMGHLFWWRLAVLALAAVVVVSAVRRRRLTVWNAAGAIGLVAIAFALGFHPGETGFWYDPRFWTALQNTLLFTAVSTPLIAGLGLVMALALQGGRRGARWYQMAFFLPYILPVSVVTLIWTYFLSPNQGLLAALLEPLGIAPIPWLSSTDTAMIAIIATTVWWTVGFNLVLFAAGLQDVDASLYEAASLDGAGPWGKFIHVTLPGIRHVLLLVMVMQVIASFQVFGQVNIMTGGGPGSATDVVIRHIYQTGFRDFELGYASAMSLVLFAIMLVVSVIQMKYLGKDESK